MIGIAQKVLAFAVTLGVLITFHELGHYFIARLVGVKVLRFSIGFGRVIWSRRVGRDGTEWALSVLPLGGYVKMVDEREGEVAPSDLPRAFNRQSVWKRAAIVVAGPLANLLLAVLLFTGTYLVGVPGQRAVLATPPAATPAAAAGLAAGEIVRAVDGTAVQSWQDLRWHLLRASGQDDATLTVERPDGTHATRKLALGSLRSSDWEGDFLAALGLRIDLGAPRVNEVLPDKPAAAAGLRAGDTIVAVDGVPMRSPADVATTTNAHPGERLRFTLRREGANSDIEVVPEATEQNGRRIGIAGMRLGVDPAAVASLAVTVRYGPARGAAAGRQQNLGSVGVHAADARPHFDRQRVAEEHQRPADDGRLCRAVCASRPADVHRLPRAHQHQFGRAQSVARSHTRRRALAVLSRRDF